MPVERAARRTRSAAALLDQLAAGHRAQYRRDAPSDRRTCSSSTGFVDLARKVVGVGSVGTRCWVVLLLGRDDDDPLFLQVKEAQASVLEPYVGREPRTPTTGSAWSRASG